MEILINFLVDNYIYVIFVVILLILALIGYIVDSARVKKLEASKATRMEEKETVVMPMDTGIKLGETVNKITTDGNAGVNAESGAKPVNTVDEVLKL